jgi:hypothetical protein
MSTGMRRRSPRTRSPRAVPAGAPLTARATRDMKRLQESVRDLPAEAWEAVVVELNHLSPWEKAP